MYQGAVWGGDHQSGSGEISGGVGVGALFCCLVRVVRGGLSRELGLVERFFRGGRLKFGFGSSIRRQTGIPRTVQGVGASALGGGDRWSRDLLPEILGISVRVSVAVNNGD